MPELALEVQGLHKTYGSHTAVDRLDLRVARGQVFGILGPNGAGKTTAVECIEGLRQPDAGTIRVLGLDPTREARAVKSRLGIQLQSTGLFPKLTVRETLELYSAFFPRSLAPDDLMDLVGLREKEKAVVTTLSGGQRQRLTLAVALVNDPDLLFLDEPTTAMDPQARRAVWDLVQELRRRGKTVVLTTHYMEEAAQLCDRIVVMDHGRIIAEGNPAELVREHFAETAIECRTPEEVALDRLKELAGVTRVATENGTTTLYSIAVPETISQLLNLSREQGFSLDHFTVRSATLEDLFLKLTGRRIRSKAGGMPAMKALGALYLATAREFLRDRTALLLTVLLPVVMAGFFGMIFSGDQSYQVDLGLVVEDTGPVGAEFTRSLEDPAVQQHLQLYRGSRAEVMEQLHQGKVAVVLLLPTDLTASLEAGRAARVQVYYDTARESEAAPALALVRQMVLEANQQMAGVDPLLVMAPQPVSSDAAPMSHTYLAGMLGIAALWLGVFATAPPLVQMREGQILRRIGATPVSRATLLGAQVLWRLTTGLVQAALLVALGVGAYGLEIANWPLFLGFTVLGTLVFVALGFLMSGLARSNESVIALGQVVQFPMMFLSGAFMPLEMLPEFLRPASVAMPLTYLVDALRQTMAAAAPLYPLWLDAAVLSGCVLAFSLLTVRFFRWE